MPVTRRGRQRFEQTEPDADDSADDVDEDEADAGEPQPSTSLADLTTEADPQQFDQTFTAGDADLTIQGRYDPVAGSRQVIPRVAYVINYNLVYNPDRDRWEPDEGNDGGGGASNSTLVFLATDQSIPDSDTSTPVAFDATQFDELDAADLANNGIEIPTTGTYLLTAAVVYTNIDTGDDLDSVIALSGPNITVHQTIAGKTSTARQEAASMTGVAQASAGETVTVTASSNGGTGATLSGSRSDTYLSVTQLKP